MPLVTGQQPAEFHSPPLSGSSHPASFTPAKSTPLQDLSSQLLHENAMGASVKHSTEIEELLPHLLMPHLISRALCNKGRAGWSTCCLELYLGS